MVGCVVMMLLAVGPMHQNWMGGRSSRQDWGPHNNAACALLRNVQAEAPHTWPIA